MTEMKPIRRGSLLERAAAVYDFGSAFNPVDTGTSAPDPVGSSVDPIPMPLETPAEPEVFAPIAPMHGMGPVDMEPVDPIATYREADAKVAGIADAAPPPFVPAPLPPVADGAVTIDRERLATQGMLVPGASVSTLAEEFRLVKRQLLNTARAIRGEAGDRARMILVSSASPNDGKTFCAINLALSLAAERDMEVLLVDADVAKPDVLKQLGVAERPGLLDALALPGSRIEDYVVATDVPQLSLLPAGARSNQDTELIASDRARELLADLIAANPRRLIVFDSPPVLAASPAATLAHQVGQVMMVVRADKTSENDLRDAVALLDGCEHIQLILNAVSFAPGSRRFGTYYAQESLT